MKGDFPTRRKREEGEEGDGWLMIRTCIISARRGEASMSRHLTGIPRRMPGVLPAAGMGEDTD